MSIVMFICFALLWGFTGLQYLVLRNSVTFATFIVATVLFVSGGGVWVVEVIL
jgi:hypothetical protein